MISTGWQAARRVFASVGCCYELYAKVIRGELGGRPRNGRRVETASLPWRRTVTIAVRDVARPGRQRPREAQQESARTRKSIVCVSWRSSSFVREESDWRLSHTSSGRRPGIEWEVQRAEAGLSYVTPRSTITDLPIR